MVDDLTSTIERFWQKVKKGTPEECWLWTGGAGARGHGRDSMNGAIFSPCRTWRYRLWRESIIGSGRVVAVMLNPSTADEATNDPTVERVWRRAQMLGFRRLDVVNIFALRSTDPAALYTAADPVGPDNDAAIAEACTGADLVLCGWGEHGAYRGRGAHVRNALTGAGVSLHVLKLNRGGSPRHPLYVGYNAKPFLWEIA